MSLIIRGLAALGIIALCAGTAVAAPETVAPMVSEIEGEIVKVVPAEKEIYVEANGKKHEYYFNEKTQVMKGETPGTYDDLRTGMKVKVTANQFGKRLDPTMVRIIE